MADEKAMGAGPAPEPGLSCARCKAAQVAALPPNGVSPRPGYRCLSCGARMRAMTGIYLVAILLGCLMLSVAAGIFKPLGDPTADGKIRELVRAPMGPGSIFFAIPLYLFVVGYSVRELVRPRPRRA